MRSPKAAGQLGYRDVGLARWKRARCGGQAVSHVVLDLRQKADRRRLLVVRSPTSVPPVSRTDVWIDGPERAPATPNIGRQARSVWVFCCTRQPAMIVSLGVPPESLSPRRPASGIAPESLSPPEIGWPSEAGVPGRGPRRRQPRPTTTDGRPRIHGRGRLRCSDIAARAAARVRDAGADVTLVRTEHYVDDFSSQVLMDCQWAAILEPDLMLAVNQACHSRRGIMTCRPTSSQQCRRACCSRSMRPRSSRWGAACCTSCSPTARTSPIHVGRLRGSPRKPSPASSTGSGRR